MYLNGINSTVRIITIMVEATTLFIILDFTFSLECRWWNGETGRKIVDLSASKQWLFVIELYNIASEGIVKIQKHMIEVDTRMPNDQLRLMIMMLISAVNLNI